MTMKMLNEMIEEELDGSCCYIHKAIYYKEAKDSQKATSFFNMANDELNHAHSLMEMAKELFESGKSEYSADVWEYLRDKAMDKKEEIQYYIAVFKM